MTKPDQPPASTGKDTVPRQTRALAERLVNQMGREHALKVCRNNHWDSVVTVIESLKD